MEPGIMVMIVYPLFFILIWLFSIALMSYLGGWQRLRRNYPPLGTDEQGEVIGGTTFKFQTMQLGMFTRYKSILHITVFKEGILIKPFVLFSLFHKPIFLPYTQMINPQYKKFFRGRYLDFKVDGKKIYIMGASVQAILSHLDIPAV